MTLIVNPELLLDLVIGLSRLKTRKLRIWTYGRVLGVGSRAGLHRGAFGRAGNAMKQHAVATNRRIWSERGVKHNGHIVFGGSTMRKVLTATWLAVAISKKILERSAPEPLG